MHVLVIEAALGGHHLVYLERIISTYSKSKHLVTVALPHEVLNNSDLVDRLSIYKNVEFFGFESLCFLNSTGLIGLIRREHSIRKEFGRVYRDVNVKEKVDLVFLPYMDYCLYACALLGSPFAKTPFSGICMRPSFHYEASGVDAPINRIDAVKNILFFKLLRNKNLKKIFSIDELLVKYSYSKLVNNIYKSKIVYLPDPSDIPIEIDVNAVREKFATPEDGRVMLVYGAIDERKGVIGLLDALENSPELRDWKIWLIGKQSNSIRDLIKGERWFSLNKNKRLICLDEYVSEEVENSVFSACDFVWVGYISHYGMSGVLIRAGMYAKPIIACNKGLIGWYTKKFYCGITIDGSISSISNALKTAAIHEIASEMGRANFNLFKNHTWTNFSKMLESSSK